MNSQPDRKSFTPTSDQDGQRALRNALGRFATGVTIVSALGGAGEKVAITANSFASVSLDPALVLWSIDNKSPNLDAFAEGKAFAIHILKEAQAELAMHCARPSDNKFAGLDYRINKHGICVLNEADTVFECTVHAAHPAGDHTIIIGAVEEITTQSVPGNDLLLFAGGRFGRPDFDLE